jgi:surface protein
MAVGSVKLPIKGAGGSLPPLTPWVRNSEWIAIPEISNPTDEVFYGVIRLDPNRYNGLALLCEGDYTVDWGDGSTPTNYTSNTKAYYTYDYATVPEAENTEGYKTLLVTITPQSAQNITTINLAQTSNTTAKNTSYKWLDINLNAPNCTSLTFNPTSFSLHNSYLERCRIGILGNITSLDNLMYGFRGLRVFEINENSTASATSANSMFRSCIDLQTVPLFDTSNVIDMSFMFDNCTSLQTVPLFDITSVTSMTQIFGFCRALQTVPLFDTSNVTNMSSMFVNCNNLQTVPLFDTSNVTSIGNVFNGCTSLQTVPLFDTSNVIDMSTMFQNCLSLQTVPLFDTSNVTNMSAMFNGCSSLQTVPLFDTSNVIDMSTMFQNCLSLQTVPLFDTSNVDSMNNLFSGCVNLQTVPLFDTSNVTNMSGMFNGCSSLQTVPLFDTSNVLSMSFMFNGCNSLQTVPLFVTTSVFDMRFMFQNCFSLQKLPLLNTTAVTSGNFSNTLSGTPRLYIGTLNGTRFTISYGNCSLAKDKLEDIFDNLGTIGAAFQSITITFNWGAPTPVSLSGTRTVGSTTITMANTTGIVTGMQVTGTGSPLTTARAVTLQDTGDTVTLNSHGLQDDDEVSFATIVTTTGIVINTIYYVVNSTTNTFQVASTIGGSPLPLTTNGSGTIRYRTEVVSIVPNTSVTVSRPMTSSGTATLAYRELRTGTALLKGWTVTD